MPLVSEMIELLVFLAVGFIGSCAGQDWSDSYMEAYRVSQQNEQTLAKDDGMYGMSNFEFQIATLKPIFGVLTAIAKIMLKIALFKAIIKFAAIICLLFFIPWLQLPNLVNAESKDTGRSDQISIHDTIERASKKYNIKK